MSQEVSTDLIKPVVNNGAAMVPTKSKYTESDLDASVKRIETLKQSGATAIYKLGHELIDIQEKQLFKLRVEKKEDGKEVPRWKSFDAFCNEELKMSPSNASKLANVARNYSETEVKLFGQKKCELILQAPPEDRPRLQEKAASGAGKREIEKEVRKVNRERGGEVTTHGKTAGQKKSANAQSKTAENARERAKKKVKSASMIAVAKILGKETVKLFKKPTRMSGEIEELPRAKTLAHGPYGQLKIASDVTMHFFVTQDAKGDLILKITTDRDE